MGNTFAVIEYPKGGRRSGCALRQIMSRIIICIDMDAFFASVEQKTNPRLRGKPIGVIGSAKRTVITTASYEARRWGVKTGMSIAEAKQACPGLTLVVGNNAKYTETCRLLAEIYLRFTPDVEVYSIDEAFLDVTTTHHLFGGPEEIGRSIKRLVLEAFGINCTVGIGPNILIAKLASDLGKPDGLRWIRQEDVAEVLRDLPVEELWGIGKKTAGRLSALGIRTCGELGSAPPGLLRSKLGIQGEALQTMGLGTCDRPVRTGPEEPKSIGHSMTLPRDIGDRLEIESHLLRLSEMVGRRARLHHYAGRTISIVIRYPDFETFTRQTALPGFTNDTHEIYRVVLRILDSLRLRDRVRLLGVCLSSLVAEPDQIPLLPGERKRQAVLRAMDRLNDRFGESTLTWGSSFSNGQEAGVISPSWRPDGVKNVPIK